MNIRSALIGLTATLALTGCQITQQSASEENKKVKIEISNGYSVFPQELAGTWICADNYWRFVIEPDGTLSWVFYPMGSAWLEPNKKVELPMKMERVSTYAPGPWKAVYDADESVLSIDITVPFFEIAMGQDTLTGDSIDIFTGPVDLNRGVWKAEWINKPTYIVNTSELEDYQLDTSGDPDKGIVVFKRFDIKYD